MCSSDLALEEYLLAITQGTERLTRHEELIAAQVPQWAMYPAVQALMCFRGFDLVAASMLVAELGDVRRFVARYAEELGWQDPSGNAKEQPAPLGGWPPWQAVGNFPGATPGGPLSGTQLFEKLAPSIARVEGKLRNGFEQGSAVAVTKSLLMTNCHVVSGALEIVVKQGKRAERPADEVERAIACSVGDASALQGALHLFE